MAQFANITITKAGLNMIAQSQAGETLIFTKAKLGDGQVGDTNIQELTDIISAKLTAELTSVTAAEEGHVVIKFVVDNSSLETGFFVRELGIYAKVGEGGAEQLYGYTNAGNYTNWLSDKSIPIDAITTQIDLVIGNASDVAFVSDKTLVYVTLQDLEDHNTDADAHANLALLINDALAPASDKNTLVNLLSNLANMLTKVTGQEDWKTGPAASIAAILSNLQGNLAVNWDGDKFTVPALGVSGLMAQNGYINFGKLFGGLIVQWGMQGAGNNWDVYYPITVATILALVAIDAGATASDELQAIGVNPSVTSFKTYSSSGNNFKLSWVAICKS